MSLTLRLLPLLLLAAATSHATGIPICVEVRSDEAKELAGLRKLVLDELGHHPRRRVVERDCESRLLIDHFRLAGQTYLTARINSEVPVRFSVARDTLAEKLTEALRLVLRHDPVFLQRDVRELSAIQRAAHSVLRRGHTFVRLELFQTIAGSDRGASFAPGGAITLARGADHFQVFARAYLAGLPGGVGPDQRALRIQTGGEGGVAYEVSARSSASFYFALAAGLQYLRYEGQASPTDRGSLEIADKLGFALSGRVGVRLFRIHNFDCDLFAEGFLPFFKTSDPDAQIVDRYTPSLQLGIGVGF
jgi:hypothetical protein